MEDDTKVLCDSCIHKEVCFAKDDYNKCITRLENVVCCDFFTIYCKYYELNRSIFSNSDITTAHC